MREMPLSAQNRGKGDLEHRGPKGESSFVWQMVEVTHWEAAAKTPKLCQRFFESGCSRAQVLSEEEMKQRYEARVKAWREGQS